MRTCFLGSLASACLLTMLVSLSAADPEPPKKDDSVEQVRKAAETAEVHGIGLNEPLHYQLDGIMELPALIALLRAKDKKGSVARVWEMLSKETQKKVLDDKYFGELGKRGSQPAALLQWGVEADLRGIVDKRPDFYTEEAFKTVLLTKEMKDLIALGKKRTAMQNAKLNWELLRKTFPDHIPEMPERFRTARVQVLGGKDVVLVLSCSNRCRWEVTLKEGAKVTGVLLCGNGTQEIVGVDAPTVYRCFYGPDGVTLSHPNDYFYGFDEKRETFKDFVKKVKNITGKDFTSFQGKYRPEPGDEPYTIRPSDK